jgi:hypothetical protein
VRGVRAHHQTGPDAAARIGAGLCALGLARRIREGGTDAPPPAYKRPTRNLNAGASPSRSVQRNVAANLGRHTTAPACLPARVFVVEPERPAPDEARACVGRRSHACFRQGDGRAGGGGSREGQVAGCGSRGRMCRCGCRRRVGGTRGARDLGRVLAVAMLFRSLAGHARDVAAPAAGARGGRHPSRNEAAPMGRHVEWTAVGNQRRAAGRRGGQIRRFSLLVGRGACHRPQSSKDFTVIPVESPSRAHAGDGVRAVCVSRLRSTGPQVRRGAGLAQPSLSTATARAGCVPAVGCMVGACGIARKPLASLGLGLTAALRVRLIPTLAPVADLSGTQPAPRSGARGTS